MKIAIILAAACIFALTGCATTTTTRTDGTRTTVTSEDPKAVRAFIDGVNQAIRARNGQP